MAELLSVSLIIQGHKHPGEWPDHSMKLTKGYKSESTLATRHSYKNSTPPIRRVSSPGRDKVKIWGRFDNHYFNKYNNSVFFQ